MFVDMLIAKAKTLALEIGFKYFCASQGWLQKFKQRYSSIGIRNCWRKAGFEFSEDKKCDDVWQFIPMNLISPQSLKSKEGFVDLHELTRDEVENAPVIPGKKE